jgi:hypothetical protein
MTVAHVPVTLAVSGKHHTQLMHHLFPGDGKEAVAIALCGRASSDRRISLLVRDVLPIPYEACRVRTPYRVTWSPNAMIPALTRAMNEHLAVVKIHSHPNGYADFSETDDISDRELFDSIYGWLGTDASQASLIMLPGGKLIGRSIHPEGLGSPLDEIRVAGDEFQFWRSSEKNEDLPEHATRIVQTFGEATYQQLRSLRVGVVGCSGTGSVIVEQSARNCVGELVLVDPDIVELKNLNRILNSTRNDADSGVAKTEVMRRAVGSMCLNTTVQAFNKDIFSPDVVHALSTCDVLFGCVDSIDGRHILNKLATYYLIPYIDMGVRIDADPTGGVQQMCGVIHTLQPGGSSLMSRGLYNSQTLSDALMRRNDPVTYARREDEGYIRGARVDQPAVISLNMQVAATAFNEFLARLHPYRVDANSQFATRRIVLSDPAASVDEPEGESCATFSGNIGLGDQDPPLGMQGLREA